MESFLQPHVCANDVVSVMICHVFESLVHRR